MDEAFDLELREERDALRTSLGRVGVWSFALDTLTAREEADAVTAIESMGYPALWMPESVESREVFSHAGWILASSERLVAASGIANIWARDPVAMANGWRMLSDAYPGRFVLGIGVSHAPSVARRGGVYEKPHAAMRNYLDAMDRAPSSAPEPEAPLRLLLAALGPKMLGLAADRALGAHPYFVPVEHTAFARQRLGRGPVLAVEQAAVLESDPAQARRIGRRYATRYLQTENYARNLRRMGWTDSDIGSGSDALIDAVIAWGDVDRVALRVREHLDAGADHVCVQVLGDDELDPCLTELGELAPALLEL
ncbi:MAG: TIGR03620 family F420-dependent LLM class oxidoreductase [Actinobacteria bacterium]|nr:TIGR03620 family F420-dependent LLM class oxidoreductase [Actinomycetota bacterium]